MRFGVLPSRVSLVSCIMVSLAMFGNAWSQPGSCIKFQKISALAGGLTAPLAPLDEFGGAVAALGDLDGPGGSAAAVAVGAIGDNDGGANRGAVYIVFLSSTGTAVSYQKISDTQGNFTAILENADDFGSSLAYLGDLDGAGPSVAALAVGAAGDDDGGLNRGCVYILFLNSAGSVLSYQKISDLEGNFPAPIDNADEFGGTVVGLGDLDGAGPSLGALAVGAVGDDDGGINRGCVYVLFLNGGGSVLSYQKISDTQGGFTPVLDDADDFGSSVAYLGDLDGAGPSAATMAVGVIGDDDGGLDRGCVYILFLSSGGSVLTSTKIGNASPGFAPLHDADELGGAVGGLGDLDGSDPTSNVALSVGTAGDDDGGSNRGATYVLFLNSSGTVTSYQKFSDTSGDFNAILDNDDEFGGALTALGDIDGTIGPNAQNQQFLVAGTSFDDDGQEDAGAIYVLFLRGNISDPVLASLFAAERLPEGVEVRWQLGSEQEPAEAWMERAVDARGPWARIITERRREGSVMIDLDRGAAADQTYFYRLVWSEFGVQYISASIEVGPGGWAVDYALLPFAPNPADEPLVVSFTLPQRSQVSLQVYDLLGRQVASLADGVFDRGLHQASWSRRAVSPGVYFVRYKFPAGQRVRRLALRY